MLVISGILHFIDFLKLLSDGDKVCFYVLFFSFCQPFVLIHARVRELQYFRLWPKFSKGSNYSYNSRLMRISVPIRKKTSYSFMFNRIYVYGNSMCAFCNKYSMLLLLLL